VGEKRLRQIKRNARQRMSGYELLCRLEDGEAALIVLDPQYRGIMDAMDYGNEGARQKARAKLPQMTDRMISLFVEQAARVLRPSGHLAFWTDKYSVGDGKHMLFYARAPELSVVDLLCWDAMTFGMGKRLRCTAQYLVVLQKVPKIARGVWKDHRIRDVWPETANGHAHAKPYQLTERLVRAVTQKGDLVVDPCAGGYGVLEACRRTGREFVGCDISGDA
jgi:site-specific DNA-methyltransferase (adenine-specific)